MKKGASLKKVLEPDDPMILGTGFVNKNPNTGRHKKVGSGRQRKKPKNKQEKKVTLLF